MSDDLQWHSEEKILFLQGELSRKTLADLWQKREQVIQNIKIVDVSALQHIDSAGLTLLIHLCQIAKQQGVNLVFSGITKKLYSLITLYNLQRIIISTHYFV